MGFINSLLSTPDNIPKCQFDFLVMSDSMIEEIKKVIKKLLIRGEKISEAEYCSRSTDYIKDAKNEIILFKTGEQQLGRDAFEIYYMMELKENMWKVINRKTVAEDGEETNIVNVVFIPSKISSVATGERTARLFAQEAVNFYENETHMRGNDMGKSFYQVLMEDELYRKLIENNNQNKVAIMSPVIGKGAETEEKPTAEFVLLPVAEGDIQRLFGDVKKKISEREKQCRLSFNPVIYAKSAEGVVVARSFSDEDVKSFADEEGSIAMKRNYVLSDGLGMARIVTMEKPFKKEIVIISINAYGQIQLSENQTKKNAVSGIECIAKCNYDRVNVVCSTDCSYTKKEDTRWL